MIHTHTPSCNQRTRRGFAFALVIMLMVIVSLGVGLAMSRLGAQTKAVARQVDTYQEHHLGRGLQEAIGAWLKQQNGRELEELLEPQTGHAMDIVLDDGSEVSVYLRDAQGVVLSNLSGLTDRQVEEGSQVLRNLVVNTTTEEYQRLTRPVGPPTISIGSASDRVLDAAARVIAGQFAERYLSELHSLRALGTKISRTELTKAATSAGLTSEQRAMALRIFATDVQLWAVIIEVRAGRGMNQGQLIARYGGVTMIRVNSRNSRSGNPIEIGAFITWKSIKSHGTEVNLGDIY